MNHTLASIADYSNAISIAIIIGCFLCMAIFIFRLNLYTKADMTPGDIIPGRMMRGVHNPFSLNLEPGRACSLRDGVWLEMRCESTCTLYAFWGVSIAQVYPAIYLSWGEYLEQILNEAWLHRQIAYRSPPKRQEPGENIRIKVEVPAGIDIDMGDVPRSKYPLVVVLLSDDITFEDEPRVSSLVSLFHLQDDQCPGKSHVICQYIRTPTSQPCQLQQLYVASSDEEDTVQNNSPSTPDEPSPSQAEENHPTCTSQEDDDNTQTFNGKCIICQSETINRALLPCRHACVCDTCFMRLDKCPMCRSGIDSYFQLSPNESSPWREDESPEEQPPKPWYERWNDRMNAYFGYT